MEKRLVIATGCNQGVRVAMVVDMAIKGQHKGSLWYIYIYIYSVQRGHMDLSVFILEHYVNLQESQETVF